MRGKIKRIAISEWKQRRAGGEGVKAGETEDGEGEWEGEEHGVGLGLGLG